jgi:monovalent cation/hydrogen antiporter
VAVALVARRLAWLPDAVALVVGGTVVGVLPFAPSVRIDPDVIFLVFLPPILYPSAVQFASEDLRGSLRAITWLAVGLVLATVGAIAIVVHLVAGISWAACFTLGAVLAPTDPVTATAVIRTAGAPERLATILEGESLVNDGTSLTVLRIAIAAVGTSFHMLPSVGEFALVAGGGTAVGAALGWIVGRLRRRIDDVELESMIDVLVAFGAFLLAERLAVSGVLATVAAGFVLGRTDEVASAETRMRGSSFWRITQFLAESMLFMLIGVAFGQVLDDPATRSGGELAALTALVVVTAVAVRMAWMFSVPDVAALLDPRVRGPDARVERGERTVLGFAGLRGALSVAAALSIPLTVAGRPFPERSSLIAIAFAAIVVLLIVPAVSLRGVLRAVGLAGASDQEARARRARVELAEAALARADELARERDLPEAAIVRVRGRYMLRLERYGDGAPDAQTDRVAVADAQRDLLTATLQAQRERLAELRRAGGVSGAVLHTLERELDLEEARLRG